MSVFTQAEQAAWGLYVHLPWCRYRCPYCAFVVDARKSPPHAAYEAALLREWDQRKVLFCGRPSSLYFGGGTPSRSPLTTLERIIQTVQPQLHAEITLEANPEDCDQRLKDYVSIGINRLSIGVQSFSEATGLGLGRRRGSRAARFAVEQAQNAGFRSISVDLIFGGPHQSLKDFEGDLQQVIDLGIPHVSLYGLSLEEGTAFERAAERLPLADEDLWRDQYDLAVTMLRAAGIDRYEVSNFARKGHESVHNQHYWQPNPWAGLGVGAHAWWPDGRRAINVADVDAYIQAADPLVSLEDADHPTRGWDFLWSMLRTTKGLEKDRYTRLTGLNLRVPPILVSQQLISENASHLYLSDQGFPIADAIARAIYRASVDKAVL